MQRFKTADRLRGLAVAAITHAWMGTLDYHAADYDDTTDPVLPNFHGPNLYLFWHEYLPFMFYLRGHCDVAFLVGLHRDAEWIAQAARYMGFQTVRGSSTRGGMKALRTVIKSGGMNLAITPDGPRGPRRHLETGAVYLASRLGIPLGPVGLGYSSPWRVRRAWDQFAVPKPYSRARAVFGPRFHVAPDLDRDGLARVGENLRLALECVTATAEQWANSNARMARQRPLRREGVFRTRKIGRAA